MNRKTRDAERLLRFLFFLTLLLGAECVLKAESESAYQLGSYKQEIATWEKNLLLAEKSGGKSAITEAKSKLGAALLMERQYERAGNLLREALEAARTEQDSKITAGILNDLGNFSASQQNYADALKNYEEAATLAHQAGSSHLEAQALCNSASAAAQAGEFGKADELNTRALQAVGKLERSHAKGFFLLTAGQTDRAIRLNDADATKRIQLRAHQSFTEALELAEATRDPAVETYALGYMGQMYETDRQPDAALSLTRRAAFIAQQQQMPEALYRWQGQIARLLKAQQNSEAAISAYRSAIETLQTIRNDVASGNGNAIGYRSFRESEGPLFLDLADLLLEKSKSVSDTASEQTLLRQAREVVEQLKTVELESYFCDECVDVQRSKSRAVETVDKETAVVYLVSLPTRTEILLGLTSGLKRFTVPVPAEKLTTEVREFRRNLETRTSFAYLAQAQQLYDWLIRPIRPFLRENGISTLVFVPDGAVRTIPFAALHDGKGFLIQDLAVAVVPGLSMVEPRPIELSKTRMLLNGVSQSVQGFDPLNYVPTELQNIEKTYPSEKLLDESFTLSSLKDKLAYEQYSIVHIASHGQFDRDVRKTFVLTHDNKLTLNELEALIRPSKYRGRPVELLVLSACQTAAGDDRAALGLAGVAIKAGARSALATLWFVNDQSTSELISEVYRQLQQTPGISKAKAVQAAQVKLLTDRRYKHPCYWSPYLIIGNWL